MILGFDFNFERQSVTFPASNVRFIHIPLCFFTERSDLHTTLEKRGDRSANCWGKFQKFTGICTANPGHRAGLAKIRRPLQAMAFEKATLLQVAATEVIAIEVRAFDASRRFHALHYRLDG